MTHKISSLLKFSVFIFALAASACAQKPIGSSSAVTYTIRLKPHADLKQELQRITQEHHLQAAVIVSSVGSLEKVSLRLANDEKVTNFAGYHEIVALNGTLSEAGLHVHLAASDKTGKTVGGHLVEGNIIYTTCELVIIEQTDLRFLREKDETYGYNELTVMSR